MQIPEPYQAPPAGVTPAGFLLWVIRLQWTTVLQGTVFDVVWLLGLALTPWAIGQAIDRGLVAGDYAAFAVWMLVVLWLQLQHSLIQGLRDRAGSINYSPRRVPGRSGARAHLDPCDGRRRPRPASGRRGHDGLRVVVGQLPAHQRRLAGVGRRVLRRGGGAAAARVGAAGGHGARGSAPVRDAVVRAREVAARAAVRGVAGAIGHEHGGSRQREGPARAARHRRRAPLPRALPRALRARA